MTRKPKLIDDQPLTPPSPGATRVAAQIPLASRMAYEIPKPKNWQDFQRKCVFLYKGELNDPHVIEYGRGGQTQRGIDLLGHRDGKADHAVGIQCRRVVKSLTREKMLADCRAALTLTANLKEIIFATTAPDDTQATDDCMSIQQELNAEGHNLRVVYYGWEALQTRICAHPEALAAFYPAFLASAQTQSVALHSAGADVQAMFSQILDAVKPAGLPAPTLIDGPSNWNSEDPALHAQIDMLRDLFQKENQYELAQRKLLSLRETTSPTDRSWAYYRIETNLASIAFELGREEEGIARFEAAFALKPQEPHAIANLALARTIQGHYEQAMALARQAMAGPKPAESGLAYLLQAAAKSDWQGDPRTLIPETMAGTLAADFGLAEYLRRRELPNWPEETIALAKRHPDSKEFARCGALAVLELCVRNQVNLGLPTSTIAFEDIRRAADTMHELVELYLSLDYANPEDLFAHVSNTAVLLRMTDRQAEAESVLTRGLAVLPPHPQLLRLLALCQAALGRREQALGTLEKTQDPECLMLRAEMMSISDRPAALEAARGIAIPSGDQRLAMLHWRMLGDFGLGLDRQDIVEDAIIGLRTFETGQFAADLLAAKASYLFTAAEVVSEEELADGAHLAEAPGQNRAAALRALASELSANVTPLERFELAEALTKAAEYDAAVDVLRDHVDLARLCPPTQLYLQALAASRQDRAFERALAQSSQEVRHAPDLLWTLAARGWNMGDLKGALEAIDLLLEAEPENTGARLLRLDILARSDKLQPLLDALEQPIESLPWKRLDELLKLASYLAGFGHLDRAISLSYRVFLENRDDKRSWLKLSSIVLQQGRSLRDSRWEMTTVAPHAAVDLQFSDGQTRFLVIEPDINLRRIDGEAFPADHPLVQSISGLKQGDTFSLQGRDGTITNIRHKFVARFHYILKNIETRFPDSGAFQQISLPADGNPLPDILELLTSRSKWIEAETRSYVNEFWPIGLLAYRVGTDVIEAANGVASLGEKLKVAGGSNAEVLQAMAQLARNKGRGVTLDLLTFWNAWRIGAIETLVAAFGQVHVPQTVVDRLRARRAGYEENLQEGAKWAQSNGGKLEIVHATPDVMQEMVDHTNAAIDWLLGNAKVMPVVAPDDLHEALRDDLREGRSDLFHSVILSLQTKTTLICDDLFTRETLGMIAGRKGAWLQIALQFARTRGQASMADYIRWLTQLVQMGQSYLGVSGEVLVEAAVIDAREGETPGSNFRTLCKLLGGALAEPQSHVVASLECLSMLWYRLECIPYRERVASVLLRSLIRGRPSDYPIILRTLLIRARTTPSLSNYIIEWCAGHFLAKSVLNG